ncbi:hypothetical protein N0V82_004680 [Gnomoniopsis sp. IMI 355080]|nr:hypothetical protein N0V82_004680 [Gnomoniopsis sp. IMI 355080]
MTMEMYFDFQPKGLFVLFVALGATALLVQYARRYLERRRFARLHGCQPISKSYTKEPFLGLDKLPETIRAVQQHKILQLNGELFKVLGNTFTVTELTRRAIVTVEPENIKTVLSLKFQDYKISHRLGAFEPLLGEGIFDSDGDHWAASRALIRPSFSRDQVADLTTLERLIQNLFSLLPRDGTTEVDLSELFFRYTMDSATEFLFGKSVDTLTEVQSEFDFAQAFQYAQNAIMTRGMLGPLRIFYRDGHADKCNRICRQFAQQFVEEAFQVVEGEKFERGEEKPNAPLLARQRRVFSHELALRTTDRHRVLDELMNVLLAGRDTTASLLSNLFFMLAKNASIWDKLRKEVASLEGRPPTYEELRSLRYVNCCINESLRIHPVVPRNDREAVRDTVLPLGGGEDGLSQVFVPKGTLVSYNLYAMHRRSDIYGEDADEFRPERWEDGRLLPRWGYLPFNGGPRICVGQRYALTEVGYVLVRMAQEFRTLKSTDLGPWEESLALTLSSRNGTKVCLASA